MHAPSTNAEFEVDNRHICEEQAAKPADIPGIVETIYLGLSWISEFIQDGLMRKGRLVWRKQKRLIELFVAGSTARTAASLVGVNKTTAS